MSTFRERAEAAAAAGDEEAAAVLAESARVVAAGPVDPVPEAAVGVPVSLPEPEGAEG
jgi:hypothetical protein